MDNQEILDNAPEDATHIDGGEYLDATTASYWSLARSKWCEVDELILQDDIRSLEDIKRIVELERRLNISECMVDNLRSVKAEMEAERYLKDRRIAELEKERDAAVNRVEMCNLSDWKIYQETDFGKKMLAIRDLEQQAKGVYNLRSTTGFWDLSTCLSRTHLREYEVILKNKAKALKEQGE